MNPTLIAVLASLGTGTIAGAVTLWSGRALAGKTRAEQEGIQAKLPAEVDSVVVQGAEQAVITMAKALEAANARSEQEAKDRAEDRIVIESLRRRVRELEAKVDVAEEALATMGGALHEARAEAKSVTDELRRLTEAQDQRGERDSIN
jgi:uncharacterized coiled-coil protein SlyX